MTAFCPVGRTFARGLSPAFACTYNRPMPPTLRQEHRDATRRRIVAAARKVFVSKGYARATIEDITAAAGVSRATLYQHFDSKYALLAIATEKMRAEALEGARQLTDILI